MYSSYCLMNGHGVRRDNEIGSTGFLYMDVSTNSLKPFGIQCFAILSILSPRLYIEVS